MANSKTVLMNLSFTKIKDFKACRYMFKRRYIDKEYKDTTSEVLKAAVLAHEHLEERIEKGTPLPEPYAHMESLIRAVEEEYPYRKAEERFAIDLTSFAPMGYEDWARGNSYGVYRAKFDLQLAKEPFNKAKEMQIWDWKTGAVREEPAQLRDYAILAFAHYPKLEVVTTRYIWMRERKGGVKISYVRDDLPILIDAMVEDMRPLITARETEEYDAKWVKEPGWKCRYCPVTDCEFNKSR